VPVRGGEGEGVEPLYLSILNRTDDAGTAACTSSSRAGWIVDWRVLMALCLSKDAFARQSNAMLRPSVTSTDGELSNGTPHCLLFSKLLSSISIALRK